VDEKHARTLVAALAAKDRELRAVVDLDGGSFWVPHAANFELEFDATKGVLSARRSPIGFPLDRAPEDADRARASGQFAKNAAALAPTSVEIVELRAQPKKWFTVLRWDFDSPKTTEKQLVAAMDKLRKMMATYRRG